MKDTVTVILAAMAEELAVLRARLAGATPVVIPGGPIRGAVRGRLGSRSVVLAVTGDGDRNARAGVAAVLGAIPAADLLVLGIAGGLSPGLREGDLVIARRVLAEGGDTVDASAAVVEAAVRASGARPGVIVTAHHIADSLAEKRRLAQLAGAESVAVVDLESAAYVAAAQRAGVPWLVIRAVSDTVDEALPGLLNRARDEGGSVRRGSVVRGLFGDPAALPVLLGLRRRLKRGAEALAGAATAVITGGASPAVSLFASPTPGTEDRPQAPLSPGALT